MINLAANQDVMKFLGANESNLNAILGGDFSESYIIRLLKKQDIQINETTISRQGEILRFKRAIKKIRKSIEELRQA